MLDFKQAIKFILLLLFSCHLFASKVDYIYSYDQRKRILISELSLKHIIYITETCSICTNVLTTLFQKKIPFIIGIKSEPRFRWFTKLKRQFPGVNIVNISSFKLNLYKGSPQLIILSDKMVVNSQIYGKTKIFKYLIP